MKKNNERTIHLSVSPGIARLIADALFFAEDWRFPDCETVSLMIEMAHQLYETLSPEAYTDAGITWKDISEFESEDTHRFSIEEDD